MGNSDVAARVAGVMERVSAAARRAGRDPSEVVVVAVSKNVEPERIDHALAAGIRDVGENRARDQWDKAAACAPGARWHFLGSIQRNKLRYLDGVELIHSLDRVREAEALQTRGDRLDRTWDVLVEVNVSGEPSKQGVAPRDVERLLESLSALPRVHARGFMFVAPQVENPEDVRGLFAQARGLLDRYATSEVRELSMGMSDDFEVAVEEGATIVRIGRAIFRPEDN